MEQTIRLATMAILLTGLILTGVALTHAQTDCIKINDEEKPLRVKYAEENIECWTKKAKVGEKQTDLQYAVLKNADLSGVYLREANFTGADLTNAKLFNTRLTSADFTNADLSNADLNGADLTEAKVSRSTTKGVDFDDWKERGGMVVD